VGYAFELSERWFAGFEGSASLSNAGFKFVDLDGAGTPIEGQGTRVATKQSFALSAQLGYMMTDRLGVYGRLGLPGAKIAYKSLGGDTMDSDSSYFSSYLGGGGLQYALGKHLFTRLEYTYSDLEIGPFGALDGRHRVMIGIGLGY
jgi:outer membrane immunogenic protein